MAIATLEQRIAFNERFNDDDMGGRWTLEGRDYVVDEMWRPMESYRCWPASPKMPVEALCPRCRERMNVYVRDPVEASPHPPSSECPGLIGIPIISTLANVKRRSGKTLNGTSHFFADLFLEPFEKMAYIASAEDQSEELIEQKIGCKIRRSPALMKLAKIVANKIEVPRNRTSLEVLAASHASITGRGFTKIIVDEARDLPARVFTALLPSLESEHGAKCPLGHGSWRAHNEVIPYTHCPTLVSNEYDESITHVCGARLVRWHARILVMSASGEIEDNPEKDWFNSLIETRLKVFEPTVHVWRSTDRINPSNSLEINSAIRRGYGDVPGLQGHLGVEMDNQPMRLGEKFITLTELDAIVDDQLEQLTKSDRPAVGFVDTSKTGDKTSLVICVDDSPPKSPAFWRLRVAHIMVWDPTDPESCPEGVIDDDLVEKHLDKIVPMFPSLLKLKVDTRVMPWAKQLVANCMRKGWGVGRIEGFEGNGLQNAAMYLELLSRVQGSQGEVKRIRLFPHDELQRELLALRKRDKAGGLIEVIDAGSDKTGRNRRKGGVHRDIAMSLAGCCLLAAELRLEMPDSTELVKQLDKEVEDELALDGEDAARSPTTELIRTGF